MQTEWNIDTNGVARKSKCILEWVGTDGNLNQVWVKKVIRLGSLTSYVNKIVFVDRKRIHTTRGRLVHHPNMESILAAFPDFSINEE